MAPRVAPRKTRENDYSNLGKAGRRTGVTVPEGPRDEHGLEEITGIFSSPTKPSPVKRPEVASTITVLSDRSVLRQSLPRSASPRKTGISGSARRSERFDLSPSKALQNVVETENTPPPTYPTPIPINGNIVRRFSPEKSPLREIRSDHRSTPQRRSTQKGKDRANYEESPSRDEEFRRSTRSVARETIDPSLIEPELDDDNVIGVNEASEDDDYLPEKEPQVDLEAQLQSDALQQEGPSSPARAKGNRKRKSDEFEVAATTQKQRSASTQPNTKKARSAASKKQKAREVSSARTNSREDTEEINSTARPKAGRPTGGGKTTDADMSSRQQKELDEVVERIRARPGKTKSLYILRRETPTDDAVTHTRSGRVSVKPLAYWRNERCVYGDSGDIPEGSRFPLSTIKEIIRTEETDDLAIRRGNAGMRNRKQKKSRNKDGEAGSADVDTDDGFEENAESWELEDGVLQGPVAQWDPATQTTAEDTMEADLAYSSLAMQTREVKNASFRYAKLLSTPFFGAGIVDVPPGGEKRPKNSRKMHMCFYVFEGRVDVEVAENRFSVGKGGLWQVPRGNMYAIFNVLDKPARIFFSQACAMDVEDDLVPVATAE